MPKLNLKKKKQKENILIYCDGLEHGDSREKVHLRCYVLWIRLHRAIDLRCGSEEKNAPMFEKYNNANNTMTCVRFNSAR